MNDDFYKILKEKSAKSLTHRLKKDKELLNFLNKKVPFLSIDSPLNQKLFHIKNNITKIPICKECNNKHCKWNKDIKKYTLFCSKSCSAKHSLKSRKNPFSDKKIQEKIKQTNLKKYDCDFFVQSNNFKEKSKNSNLKKYNETHHLKNRVQKEKYCDFNFWDNNKEKIKITFNEKYGNHPTQNRFSKDTLKKLNDKEWLYKQHITNKRSLSEISIELEKYDISSISDRMYQYNIPIQHYYVSICEKEIRNHLIDNNIKIVTNDRKMISPYELDIYLPEEKIAIEYCGLYWHSEVFKNKNYHKIKYNLCEKKGIRLIQIFEDEWLTKKEFIKKSILHKIGKSQNKIYARKCKIKIVPKQDKKIFLNLNHIQGNCNSSINIGLYHDGILVAIMAFIKEKDHFLLNRYTTSCHVVGGFSKLLKNFEKRYNNPKIITFADLRWSNGNLYNKTGFKIDKIIPPDYFWIKGNNRFHKFNFRHSRMKKKLNNYNSDLSETDNMHNHGFLKIYDAGKIKFIK